MLNLVLAGLPIIGLNVLEAALFSKAVVVIMMPLVPLEGSFVMVFSSNKRFATFRIWL